jgi:hypothetical protein
MEFEDIKEKIVEYLSSRDIDIDEPVTLVDGVVKILVSDSIPFSPLQYACNKSITMFVLCGNDSGRLYFFPLNLVKL